MNDVKLHHEVSKHATVCAMIALKPIYGDDKKLKKELFDHLSTFVGVDLSAVEDNNIQMTPLQAAHIAIEAGFYMGLKETKEDYFTRKRRLI